MEIYLMSYLSQNTRKQNKKHNNTQNALASKATFAKYLSPSFQYFAQRRNLQRIQLGILEEEASLQIGRDYIEHTIQIKSSYANSAGSMSLDKDIDRVKVNAKYIDYS